MTRPRSNLRLFVASYPPAATACTLLDALRSMTLPDHRPTPIDQVHLTLQFIGDVPTRDLDRTLESVRRAASGLERCDVRIEAFISLPRRGPSRLVAVRTDCPPTVGELHRRLVTRFARRAQHPDGYLPHLTLARFRRPDPIVIDTPVEVAPFPIEEIRIMKSTLAPDGTRHHVLEEVALA